MKITGICLTFILTALLIEVMINSFSNVNAQNSIIKSPFQNSKITNGENSYILIFGQRTIGNIDNST